MMHSSPISENFKTSLIKGFYEYLATLPEGVTALTYSEWKQAQLMKISKNSGLKTYRIQSYPFSNIPAGYIHSGDIPEENTHTLPFNDEWLPVANYKFLISVLENKKAKGYDVEYFVRRGDAFKLIPLSN